MLTGCLAGIWCWCSKSEGVPACGDVIELLDEFPDTVLRGGLRADLALRAEEFTVDGSVPSAEHDGFLGAVVQASCVGRGDGHRGEAGQCGNHYLCSEAGTVGDDRPGGEPCDDAECGPSDVVHARPVQQTNRFSRRSFHPVTSTYGAAVELAQDRAVDMLYSGTTLLLSDKRQQHINHSRTRPVVIPQCRQLIALFQCNAPVPG